MNAQKLKVDTEQRRNLYYNEYRFRVVINIDFIEKFRYYKSYDDYINHTTPWRSNNKPLANKDEIVRFYDYRDQLTDDCKIRIEHGRVIIYGIDLAHLESAVDKIDSFGSVKYYEVSVPKEQGTIEFSRPPKFKYRNYFKAKSITIEDRKTIHQFIIDQTSFGAEVSLNDSMKDWLLIMNVSSWNRGGYLREGFYVEYNDCSMEILLSLSFGEYLKPVVYKLVQRTTTV